MEAALASKQAQLSRKLDTASWNSQFATAVPARKALLLSEAEPGARAFLAALPHGRTRMEGPIFLAELRRRLGVPDAAQDTWCPRCDGILDTHSHHAGMCLAGGDRTRRHHAARGLIAAWSERAGFAPEIEKAELLLPQRPEDTRVALRRPADVYLPALEGSPTALDLAITGPLRSETLAEAGRHALAAASAYAQLKATHLNTAQMCAAQGIRFRPVVAESTGAWETDASHILLLLSRGAAAREGSDPGALHACLLQELSVAIRASHARAVLSRRAAVAASMLDTTTRHFALHGTMEE